MAREAPNQFGNLELKETDRNGTTSFFAREMLGVAGSGVFGGKSRGFFEDEVGKGLGIIFLFRKFSGKLTRKGWFESVFVGTENVNIQTVSKLLNYPP